MVVARLVIFNRNLSDIQTAVDDLLAENIVGEPLLVDIEPTKVWIGCIIGIEYDSRDICQQKWSIIILLAIPRLKVYDAIFAKFWHVCFYSLTGSLGHKINLWKAVACKYHKFAS